MKSKLLLSFFVLIASILLLKTATSYTTATINNSTSIQVTNNALISIKPSGVVKVNQGGTAVAELKVINNVSNSLTLLEDSFHENGFIIHVEEKQLRLGKNEVLLNVQATDTDPKIKQNLNIPLKFKWDNGTSEIMTELKIIGKEKQ